jgi:hypothetical protein
LRFFDRFFTRILTAQLGAGGGRRQGRGQRAGGKQVGGGGGERAGERTSELGQGGLRFKESHGFSAYWANLGLKEIISVTVAHLQYLFRPELQTRFEKEMDISRNISFLKTQPQIHNTSLWMCLCEPGFTLPNRTSEPPAFGFGQLVGKPRLTLETEQI